MRASNGAGSGVWSDAAEVATAADEAADEPVADAVPDKMDAATFSSVAVGGFTVGWVAASVPSGASAVSGYEVEYLVKPVDGSEPDWSGATSTEVADASATSVAVSGLEAATAYLVRVRASNGAGSGVWSDAAEVSTAADEGVTGEVVVVDEVPDKMDAATFSSVTVSGFTVGWVSASVPVGASAVSGYEVEYLVKPVDGSEPDWSGATSTEVADASATSVEVTGLAASTAHLVRVRASNGAGSGVWSDAAEVSTAADEAADEPVTGEVATADAVPDKMGVPTFAGAGAGWFAVQWTAASVPAGAPAVTGYEVAYLKKPADGSPPDWSGASTVTASASMTWAAVTGLEAATAYLVRVRASNSNGSGVWSDAAEGSTIAADAPPVKMAMPTFADVGAAGITVQWTAASVPPGASAVTGYEVAYLKKPADGSPPDWSSAATVTAAAPDTSVAVSGLEAATAYLVRVRAQNSAGDGAWSDAAEATTVDAPPAKMAAPTFTEAGADRFTVNWTAASVPAGASAVTGYEVAYLKKPAGGSPQDWSSATSVGVSDESATSVAVSGLEAATAYLVRVRAGNGAGDGAWSDAAEASTTTDSGPVLESATVDGVLLVLTFDRALMAARPALSAFTVKGAGGTASQHPTGVAVSGSAVTLALGTAATLGDTVTVTYVVPAADPVRDRDGNEADGFTDVEVTNNTLECETISGIWLVPDSGLAGQAQDLPEVRGFDDAGPQPRGATPDVGTLPRGAPLTYYDGDEARTVYPVLASPGPGAGGASGASGPAGPPAYVSESGTVMWLPGGVVLLLDPTWSAARADSFLAANGVARSRASELGWIDNGFLIEAGPGRASIELANSLATLDGVIISTPDWAVWTTPHQLDSREPRAADSTDTGTDCPDPESDRGAAAAGEVTAEQARPNRPTSIRVTARTQALAVTWVAATNPNVVAYDLRWIRSDAADKADANWTVVDDFWTSGDLTGLVTDLTDGVSYDVQMRAVANVDHNWTATVTGEPRPLVPEVELIAGDRAITVALTQPEGERHLRVQFDVAWIRSDAAEPRTWNSRRTWGRPGEIGDRQIAEIVDGLTNGVSYDVRVRASTDVEGQWSETLQVTPYEPPHEIPDRDDLPSLNTSGAPARGRFAGTDAGDLFKLVAEASTDVLILVAGSVATSCSLTDADGVEIDGGHRGLVPAAYSPHDCAIRATLTADSYPATFYVKVVRADPEPIGEGPFLLYANYEQPLGNSISAATPVDIGTFGGWNGGSHTSAGEADYLLIRTEREHWPFIRVVHPDHVPSVVLVDSEGDELRTGEHYPHLHTTVLRTRVTGGDHYVKIEAPQSGFEGHYFFLWLDELSASRSDDFQACENWTKFRALSQPAIYTDEMLACQWHLENVGNHPLGGERITAGEDANVLDVHRNAPNSGPAVHLGEGVGVAVMDTGIDIDHQDLRDNTDPARSHSFCNQRPPPSHTKHGTNVAGLVAARDNDFGVRGVAPRATLHDHQAVDCLIGWSNLADAMTRNMADIGVHNNSWDFGQTRTLVGNPLIYDRALETGVNRGYGGKGVVYVRSSGNQHHRGGDANLSEMRNHYTTMAVCAADSKGIRAWYSEAGANLWVCGPSQGNPIIGQGLPTTDLYDRYRLHFNGTSASAPVVSGVAALVRAANPALTWRDVKLILAGSARRNASNHADWKKGAVKYGEDKDGENPERYWFNNTYGFGMVDADAAVRLAKRWTNLPTMLSRTASTDERKAIPDAPASGRPTQWATSDLILDDGIEFIEHVEIEITLNARNFRQLQIELKPPGQQPKRVILAQNASATIPGKQWTKTYRLGASGFLGEPAAGRWRLRIQDQVHGTVQRTLSDGRDVNNALLEGWTIVVRGHGSSVQGFHDGNSTRLRIEENSDDGALVGAVPASDEDGDTLTYWLTSTDHQLFAIDGSGRITVASGTTLDYEARSSYHVKAHVSDGKDSNGIQEQDPTADDTIDVTILVVDLNEPPDAPGPPTVSADGPGRLNVTWTPPNTEGRPAVADYNLRYFKGTEAPENVDDWVHENEGAPDPGTNTSATITELQPGTSYVVQVNAWSHEGTSEWSGLGVGTTNPGPALDSATVAGASLVLAFDKALMTAAPPASAFTVKGAGEVASQIPTAVSVSGSYVILTLGTAAVDGNTVTMSYAVPDTNPIRDTDGNPAGSFTDKAVTNDTLSGTALVSNLGEKRVFAEEWTGAAFRRAQAFTTGSYPLGYTMTRLELELVSYLRHEADYTVKIHNASDDGPGDTVVGTLTNPASLPSRGEYHHVEYTTSGGGIDLDGSTTYYVVWDMVAQARTEGGLWTTPSDEEDSGGALGWSIGDEALVWSFGDEEWSGVWHGGALKMRMHGSHSKATPAATAPAKADAPRLVSGHQQLTVSWSAPATGGSAITSYDLRHSTDGNTWTDVLSVWTTGGGALSHVITSPDQQHRVLGAGAGGERRRRRRRGQTPPRRPPRRRGVVRRRPRPPRPTRRGWCRGTSS